MSTLVISNARVVTMDPARAILTDAWIRIENGVIVEIGTGEPPETSGSEHIDARNRVVTPGLISVHNHVIDSLLRGGLESDRSLFDWLLNVYYTGTSAYTPNDCQTAARLTTAEAIRAGVTTVVDNWGVNNGADQSRVDSCAEATLCVYRESGMRVTFARMYSDTFPQYLQDMMSCLAGKVGGHLDFSTLVEDTDSALSSIEDLMNRYHGSENGRIRICPSPILPQTNTVRGMQDAKRLAEKFDMIFPIHLAESEVDSRMFPASGGGGLSAVEFLHSVGLLSSRTVAAHCVWLSTKDLRLLKVNDVKVAHCPTSNMFLGAGIAPIEEMIARGITVGLGTDDTNASSNVSVLKDMRHAALLAKVAARDAGALTAEKVLEMATIDGAKVLGMDDDIGSVEVGKKADLVLWNSDQPHWFPCHHIPSVLVYQAQCSDPDTVIVDGRILMRGRELTHLSANDEARLLRDAQEASEAITRRAGMGSLKNRSWQALSRS